MAKRKEQPPVPAAALMIELHDILDRVGTGRPVAPEEIQAAAAAAAAMRRDWIRAVSDAIGFLVPGSPETVAFKNCVQSVGTLFVQHGLVSAAEMQTIWATIEMAERG